MSEFIQIHALTVYPPGNLNRDDLGRPKTAIFGGTQRLRISSQSLKRAWRKSDLFRDTVEGKLGEHTRTLGDDVYRKLVKRGLADKDADGFSKKIASKFGDLESEKDKEKSSPEASKVDRKQKARQTKNIVFITALERDAVDDLVERIAGGYAPSPDDYDGLLTSGKGSSADVALFGRMLAANFSEKKDRPKHDVDVDAAVQVAHAITVHKVTVEDDYFTAVDDLNDGSEDAGAAHIGTTEFGSGVFYQYICINRSLLDENLGGNRDLASLARRALAEACAKIAPSGKQNSFATRARAVYMLAERGDEQPRNLAMAFLKPVTGDDFLESAIQSLEETRDRMDKVYGPCARERCSFNVPTGEGSLRELLDFVAK